MAVDRRLVDFDILEGRKPPSKEELEEGEREHLFVVDQQAWEEQTKERLERLPLSPGQEILELKKRVSDLEAQLKDIWGHLRKLNKNGTQ